MFTGLLAVLSKSAVEPCVNRSTVSASDQRSTTRGTEKGMFARFYFPFCLHIDFKALTQKVQGATACEKITRVFSAHLWELRNETSTCCKFF